MENATEWSTGRKLLLLIILNKFAIILTISE